MQNYFKKQVSKILDNEKYKKLNYLKIKEKLSIFVFKLEFVSWSFNPSEVAWIGYSAAASVKNVDCLTIKRSEYNEVGFTEKVMETYFNSV